MIWVVFGRIEEEEERSGCRVELVLILFWGFGFEGFECSS